MKKLKLLLFSFTISSAAISQLAKSITLQYIPRIKEQSLSLIYHQNEKLAFHFNLGYIYGYTFLQYIRVNVEDTQTLFTKGSGFAFRVGPRFCRIKKEGNYEIYLEPFITYKYYAYSDSLFYRILNTGDTTFYNDHHYYPYKKEFDKMMNYTRTGIQVGIMAGIQLYLPNNFTASINAGMSLRRQSYSNGYSNTGASLHLNFGIGYVFRKTKR
jgi:hypothetical protein